MIAYKSPWVALVTASVVALFASASTFAQEVAPHYRGPIEITADALEVRQDTGIAIFTGTVRAVQGDILLAADRVLVSYAPGGADVIRSIEAQGNVFFSTPTETAEGDTAVYDVENGVITLAGSVVLTRSENVVRGNRLVLNLATGLSRIEGGSDPVAGDGGGRVRGLFVPNEAAAGGVAR